MLRAGRRRGRRRGRLDDVLSTAAARQLDRGDLDAVRRALALDPVASCMVAARVAEVGVEPFRVHGELWTAGTPEACAPDLPRGPAQRQAMAR